MCAKGEKKGRDLLIGSPAAGSSGQGTLRVRGVALAAPAAEEASRGRVDLMLGVEGCYPRDAAGGTSHTSDALCADAGSGAGSSHPRKSWQGLSRALTCPDAIAQEAARIHWAPLPSNGQGQSQGELQPLWQSLLGSAEAACSVRRHPTVIKKPRPRFMTPLQVCAMLALLLAISLHSWQASP